MEMKEILIDALQDLVLTTKGEVIKFKFKLYKKEEDKDKQD
jgi:hypothetical protein